MALSVSQLRGYLLEEALAWLMRHSGYDLLVDASQDRDELIMHGSELRVLGRGTSHQVDVLGEFAFTPAFSLPVRLFLEAKHYGAKRCGLDIVRNAHGTLADVNQNYVARVGSRPRRRFQYCYALFSASGFSPEAEAFAIAHQISLVDLSVPSFAWLLGAVARCADELHADADRHNIATFPVRDARARLRGLLGTTPIASASTLTARAERAFAGSLEAFADRLLRHGEVDLLVGFPPAPFILPLVVSDRAAFIAYAIRHPSHAVWISRTGDGESYAEWTARPASQNAEYRLSFALPSGLEEWISENEDRRRSRVRTVKTDFLATITIYFQAGDELRVCHLRYDPGALREQITPRDMERWV
ncbi:hypothetical protein [Dactylosporangium sp. NPDC006015]|uniref:hypothetical protein n=1 Tax=Dactylosporangium sp. NPDC006015 TaxID=3154576 RepID=UPI0033A2047F